MRIVVLAADQTQSLDVLGPVEVFDGGAPAYELTVVTPGGGDVALSNGLRLSAAPLPGPRTTIDTILVAGGEGARRLGPDDEAIRWLRRAAPRARRVASVCTGAFALATAGLLEGRRATTHWAWCASLAREHGGVTIDPDPIYVRDGDVWTSAGVTAGMDLALALVEEDLGRDVALEAARWLVLFLKRPGGQSQFSAGLAARACLSERHFARAWRAETGLTPAAYVEGLRVERARALLEDGRSVDAA